MLEMVKMGKISCLGNLFTVTAQILPSAIAGHLSRDREEQMSQPSAIAEGLHEREVQAFQPSRRRDPRPVRPQRPCDDQLARIPSELQCQSRPAD